MFRSPCPPRAHLLSVRSGCFPLFSPDGSTDNNAPGCLDLPVYLRRRVSLVRIAAYVNVFFLWRRRPPLFTSTPRMLANPPPPFVPVLAAKYPPHSPNLLLSPCQVLHVANHVLSMLTQTGDRGLPAALQANDPAAFEGGEGALLRCVEELVTCIRISERDTLARLICRCAAGFFVGVGLLLRVWCVVVWCGVLRGCSVMRRCYAWVVLGKKFTQVHLWGDETAFICELYTPSMP